jgi:hypothetical protein
MPRKFVLYEVVDYGLLTSRAYSMMATLCTDTPPLEV